MAAPQFENQVVEWADRSDQIKHVIHERLLDVFPTLDSIFCYPFLSFLVLVLTACLVLLQGVFFLRPQKPSAVSWFFAVIGTIISLALSLGSHGTGAFLASGFLVDGISQIGFIIINLGTLLTLILMNSTQFGRHLVRYETLSLLLLASAGLMITVSAGDFVTFFIGIEMTSLCFYIIIALNKENRASFEASIKYFLMGACAAATMLMGGALIYSAIGSLRWEDLNYLVLSTQHPIGLVGVLFLMVGLAFKLGLAPFHTWSPDIYQGAPAHISGYMSSLVKFSVCLVFLRILGSFSLTDSFGTHSNHLLFLFFAILSVLSIVTGSLFGLVTNSLKRLLGYSSVANSGYFALALACLAKNPSSLVAKQALLSYAVIYAFLSLCLFALIAWIEEGNREDLFRGELPGLGQKNPKLASLITVFLLALGGLPPLIGFVGKFILLSMVMQEGVWILAAILVFFSIFSMVYYLSIIIEIWFKEPSEQLNYENSNPSSLSVFGLLLVACLFLISFFGPQWAYNMSYDLAKEGPKTTKLAH